MLQYGLELTRERRAGTKELDVPREELSSSQQWALALRKAKQVLSCVTRSAASGPGKGIFPSIDYQRLHLESLGQIWVLKHNIRVALIWLRGWNM